MKSNFHIIFRTYKDKKQLEISLGKNPENYESICNETYTYEQKPINVDDFNEVEEKEVKERFEKRKQRRQEVPEKNQTVEKKKKKHENRKNLR